MFYKQTTETSLFIDPEAHTMNVEVYFDKQDEPFITVSASPRDLVREIIEMGYPVDVLDRFLDTLYETVEVLENHLNCEDPKDDE